MSAELPLPPSKRQRTEASVDPRRALISSSGLQLSRKIPFDSAYLVSEYLCHLPGSAYRPPCCLNKRRYCVVCDQDLRIVNAMRDQKDTPEQHRLFLFCAQYAYLIGPTCSSTKGCVEWYKRNVNSNVFVRSRIVGRDLQPPFDSSAVQHHEWRKTPGRPPVLHIGAEGTVSPTRYTNNADIYGHDLLLEECTDDEEEVEDATPSAPVLTYGEENKLLLFLTNDIWDEITHKKLISSLEELRARNTWDQDRFKKLAASITSGPTTRRKRMDTLHQLVTIAHKNFESMHRIIKQMKEEVERWLVEYDSLDEWEEKAHKKFPTMHTAEVDRVDRRLFNYCKATLPTLPIWALFEMTRDEQLQKMTGMYREVCAHLQIHPYDLTNTYPVL